MKRNNYTPAPTLFGDFILPKIRTYRIPYTGSKNQIASQLIEFMLSNVNGHRGRRFVDGFCGGGAILYGVQQTRMFGSILGNDLHTEMIDLHRNLPDLDLDYIARTPCLLRPNAEAQAKYPWLKLIDEIEPKYQMAFRIVYSFGNNCVNNLWGGDMIVKYELAWLLWFEPELMGKAIADFAGSDIAIPYIYTGASISSRYEDYKRHVGLYRGKLEQLQRLERLERLEQLERLERLERIQQLEQLGHSIAFTSVGYDQIEYRPNDVVYFDPPYRGTLVDKRFYTHLFDNDAFEDFARSLKCPVFISEYAPKIGGFQPILKIGKLSTFKNDRGGNGQVLKADKQRYEFLHWNGIR